MDILFTSLVLKAFDFIPRIPIHEYCTYEHLQEIATSHLTFWERLQAKINWMCPK